MRKQQNVITDVAGEFNRDVFLDASLSTDPTHDWDSIQVVYIAGQGDKGRQVVAGTVAFGWASYAFYDASQSRIYRRSCIRSKREEQRLEGGGQTTYT